MSWTDERIERLKEMWARGMTASQIAEELGAVSRNAVIGKAHRLGLPARPSPVRPNDVDEVGGAGTEEGAMGDNEAAEIDAADAFLAEADASAAALADGASIDLPATTLVDLPEDPPFDLADPADEDGAADEDEADAEETAAATALVAADPADAAAAAADPADPAAATPPPPTMRSIGPGGFVRQGPGEQQAPIPPAPPRRLVPAKASPAIAQKTSLLDLNERICKWPLGHPGEPDFHFCGRPANPGFPYCVEHCGVAYQAQLPRRDRKPPPPLPFGGSRVR